MSEVAVEQVTQARVRVVGPLAVFHGGQDGACTAAPSTGQRSAGLVGEVNQRAVGTIGALAASSFEGVNHPSKRVLNRSVGSGRAVHEVHLRADAAFGLAQSGASFTQTRVAVCGGVAGVVAVALVAHPGEAVSQSRAIRVGDAGFVLVLVHRKASAC